MKTKRVRVLEIGSAAEELEDGRCCRCLKIGVVVGCWRVTRVEIKIGDLES